MAKKKKWRGVKTSLGGTFVAGTSAKRARTPRATCRCFAP
jgi:hypothetical protein